FRPGRTAERGRRRIAGVDQAHRPEKTGCDQVTSRACHPERSEAKSKDPGTLSFSYATRFLDFARSDHDDITSRLSSAPSAQNVPATWRSLSTDRFSFRADKAAVRIVRRRERPCARRL